MAENIDPNIPPESSIITNDKDNLTPPPVNPPPVTPDVEVAESDPYN